MKGVIFMLNKIKEQIALHQLNKAQEGLKERNYKKCFKHLNRALTFTDCKTKKQLSDDINNFVIKNEA